VGSDLGQGDRDIPYIIVQPADADTVATLTVRRPDGTSTAVPVTGGALTAVPGSSPVEYSQRWEATDSIEYDQPARWVLHWDVEGTGEGDEDVEVWVVASPTAGGPTWTPGRSRVANYLPHRTLVRDLSTTTGSQDVLLMSWDSTTTPTGVQVDRLIADGVAYIGSRLAPVHSTSEAAAGVLVCLYTAAMIERSWPADDQSLQRANDLEKRLDVMLKDLVKANTDANTEDDVTYPTVVQPYWSFPAADPRYDDARYW
jgi:hypothetical protein